MNTFLSIVSAAMVVRYLFVAPREWSQWRRTRKRYYLVQFALSLVVIGAFAFSFGLCIRDALKQ